MDLDREIDDGEGFRVDDFGMPYLPKGMTMEGNLYVLPNGKYLPSGTYKTDDGGALIYEPRALSPFADLLAGCTEE